MASAYATLAAKGVYSKPMAIRRVVLADGSIDRDAGWGVSKRKRVMPDGVAYEVTQILQRNITGGTGTGANYGDPAAAGKTGTTDNSADAWFAGYTPKASTVVWVGYPKAQVPMSSVHGITVTGGSFPASIWQPLHVARPSRPSLNPAGRARGTRRPGSPSTASSHSSVRQAAAEAGPKTRLRQDDSPDEPDEPEKPEDKPDEPPEQPPTTTEEDR